MQLRRHHVTSDGAERMQNLVIKEHRTETLES